MGSSLIQVVAVCASTYLSAPTDYYLVIDYYTPGPGHSWNKCPTHHSMLRYPLAQQCRLLNWFRIAYSLFTGSFVYCRWVVFKEWWKLCSEQWSSPLPASQLMAHRTNTRPATAMAVDLELYEALHILLLILLNTYHNWTRQRQ